MEFDVQCEQQKCSFTFVPFKLIEVGYVRRWGFIYDYCFIWLGNLYMYKIIENIFSLN